MAFRFVPGYPYGNEKGGIEILVDLDGPASYNNTGTFNTSGQQVNALDFGIGGFEDIGSDMTYADQVPNQNVVEIVLGATIAGATNLTPAPGAGQPAVVPTTAVVHWFTAVTRSAEVANAVNLSGRFVRLRIIGV